MPAISLHGGQQSMVPQIHAGFRCFHAVSFDPLWAADINEDSSGISGNTAAYAELEALAFELFIEQELTGAAKTVDQQQQQQCTMHYEFTMQQHHNQGSTFPELSTDRYSPMAVEADATSNTHFRSLMQLQQDIAQAQALLVALKAAVIRRNQQSPPQQQQH